MRRQSAGIGFCYVAVAVMACFAWSGIASAQDTALIIGNHDYDAGSGANDLPGVVPDIALMKSKLENAGWNTVVRTNRTAAQMIADITANSPPGSRKYVVYYAGHGNNNAGQHGQWVGRDGSEMSAQDYVNALGTRANKTLTILDSCGGGEFADTVNGLAPGIGFITSTTDLECADKGPGGGVFTQCFGNALNTTADQMPNGNANGETSAAEAANYGINNCGTVDQHPTWDGDHGGYILGRPKPDPIPTVSEWGLIIMGLLLLIAGTIVTMRRRSPAGAHSLA
ncbi:Caspase domain protein [Phycisphaerae bacterium RAS2]|nr:Caspase domain protein [Phycisphaerae bacterium RAS2]